MSRLLLFLSLVFAIFSGCGYNQLRGLDQEVRSSWAEVQIQCERRDALISAVFASDPSLTSTLPEALKSVNRARVRAGVVAVSPDQLPNSDAIRKFQSAQAELSLALSRFERDAGSVPMLRSDQRYQEFRTQLEETEASLQVARKGYSDQVAAYNHDIRIFPMNLTAKFLLHLEAREPLSTDLVSEKPLDPSKNQG